MNISTDNVLSTLSPDAFLKLFVTQIKYQDPTQPLDPGKMMTELAQLASLHKLEQLNTSFSRALDIEKLILAERLIGTKVSFESGDTLLTGTAQSAVLERGLVGVVVDETFVPLEDIREIHAENVEVGMMND